MIRTERHEFKAVMALWAIMLAGALVALVALNANSLRLINYIEYVKAGRYQRTIALHTEAEKHARQALQKAQKLNQSASQAQTLLPGTDADYKAAIELYQRALALDPREPFHPDHAKAYTLLGQLHEAVGNEKAYMRAFIGGFLCSRDLENARQYAQQLVERHCDDNPSWRLLADIELRRKDAHAAREALAGVERTTRPRAAAHELHGRIALLEGKTTSAVEHFYKAVNATPQQLDLRKQLAHVLAVLGRNEDATQVLQAGMENGGRYDSNYLHRYGSLLLKLQHNKRACEILEAAVSVERNSSELWWMLARAYQRLGKTFKASDAMQQALRLNPELRGKILEEP